MQVNSVITLVYCKVSLKINTHIFENQCAWYAQETKPNLSKQLIIRYGKSFDERNLRRMMQFASLFSDAEIVSPLARQLSLSNPPIVILK